MLLSISLTAALAQTPPEPAAPPIAPPPPPIHGLFLSIDAYGKLLEGYVLADAAKLNGLGLSLWTESAKHEGLVPIIHGMRLLGLPQGERVVAEVADSLLYFDANNDRYLDALDPAFGALSLFEDKDKDKKIDPGEVRTFASVGIESISRYGEVRMVAR